MFIVIKSIIRLLLGKIKNEVIKDKPKKYRLVPDKDGLYTLEMYRPNINLYIAEAVGQTKESAAEVIKNLEGEIIYYLEK